MMTNSPCIECPRADAFLKAHIYLTTHLTIGHHELRLVRLADYTSRLPLTIFRRNRTMISNPISHYSPLFVTFVTNIGSIELLADFQKPNKAKKGPFNLHESR